VGAPRVAARLAPPVEAVADEVDDLADAMADALDHHARPPANVLDQRGTARRGTARRARPGSRPWALPDDTAHSAADVHDLNDRDGQGEPRSRALPGHAAHSAADVLEAA
jgi:hypothetical protein